jgi:hypothetical protein
MKILFFLGLLSLSVYSFAQGNQGHRIKECYDLVDWLNKKTSTSNSQYRFCNNAEDANNILNNKKYIKNCLSQATEVTGIKVNILNYCRDLQFFSEMEQPEFLECLDETKKNGFQVSDHARIDICRSRENLAYFKDETFQTCMSTLKGQQPKVAIKDNFIECQNPKRLQIVTDPEFQNCRDRLKDYKLPENVTSGFCAEAKNQTISKFDQVTSCMKKIDNIFGKDRAAEYCVGSKDSDKLEDPEIFACLMDTNQTVSPSFFLLQEKTTIFNQLQMIINDCVADKNRVPLKNSINYLGAYYFSAKEDFQKSIIGGLSGITYDSENDVFDVISDDSGRNGPSRFYTFKASFGEKFQFSPLAKILLSTTQDAESIQLAGKGIVAITSETISYNRSSLIRFYNMVGNQVGYGTIPEKYIKSSEPIEGDEPETKNRGYYVADPLKLTKGMQNNKGFEALAIPENNKNVIFAVSEAPLHQDTMPDRKIVRILKLTKDHLGYFNQTQEFAYEMHNSPENGISDILALNDHELLILERRFDPKTNLVTAVIFKVNLSEAQDVSHLESFRVELKQGRVVPILSKTLLIDLDDMLPFLPAGLRKIDNVEGMALGPEIEKGYRALVIVTDNNFSNNQYNQVLVLKLPIELK